ncbi:MAG TPA: AAA family ATPase [Planctomycetota bacterium]|nr:AAA family ATPase [Planctomycetota bacterium]
MRRIALVNQKGGVGKTTTAVNLSDAIARLDRKVLLIDLDPQSNATISLGVAPHEQKQTSYSLLTGQKVEPLQLSPNLHLIPANLDLAGADLELATAIGREHVLRDALADLQGYDFVLMDCSPSLGLLSINALTFAKEVIVPLQCEFLALHGVSLLIRTIDLVKRRLNPTLEITGVVPCMYDVRKGLARETLVEIERFFGTKVFRSRIRTNVRLAEAPSHGQTIFEYAPDSNGAEDYLSLAREIVGIELIPRTDAAEAGSSAPDEPPAAAADPAEASAAAPSQETQESSVEPPMPPETAVDLEDDSLPREIQAALDEAFDGPILPAATLDPAVADVPASPQVPAMPEADVASADTAASAQETIEAPTEPPPLPRSEAAPARLAPPPSPAELEALIEIPFIEIEDLGNPGAPS